MARSVRLDDIVSAQVALEAAGGRARKRNAFLDLHELRVADTEPASARAYGDREPHGDEADRRGAVKARTDGGIDATTARLEDLEHALMNGVRGVWIRVHGFGPLGEYP